MSVKLKLLGMIFSPFVVIYTFLIHLRNRFYDWGWLKAKTIDAPVISVGNIQIGGTGKTPFVESLAKQLIANGYQTAVLTRGYKREGQHTIIVEGENRAEISPETIGDEPFVLTQNVPNLIMGVDKRRYTAAQKILAKYPKTIFLMDDGFQHRPLKRDLDIVLIDVTRWSKVPFLFPLSHFRDVKSSLKRAQLFVLTRIEGNEQKTIEVKRILSDKFNGDIIYAEVQPKNLVSVRSGEIHELTVIQNKNIAAFCGLANPSQFYNLLSHLGGKLCFSQNFADHYYFQNSDVRELQKRATRLGAEHLITTQKDAVKMGGIEEKLLENIFYLEMELKADEEKILWEHLSKVLSNEK